MHQMYFDKNYLILLRKVLFGQVVNASKVKKGYGQ